MASFEAAADHAEYAAERHRVPVRADERVIQDDEQTIDTEVQNCSFRTVFCAVVYAEAGVFEQQRIFFAAAEPKTHRDGKQKDNRAERVAQRRERVAGAHACRLGERSAQHLIQQRPQEKRRQTHRKRRRIQAVALVDIRAVREPCRQDKAHTGADDQRQHKAAECHAVQFRAGIAQKKVGRQRAKTRCKEHRIDQTSKRLFLHEAVQRNAREQEPHVQNRDAPEAEACRQEKRQDAQAVGLCAGQRIQQAADQADQKYVQKGCGKAAVARVEKALGELRGLRAELGEVRQKLLQTCAGVDHADDRGNGAQRRKKTKQTADGACRFLELFFHNLFFLSGKSLPPEKWSGGRLDESELTAYVRLPRRHDRSAPTL